MKKDRFEEEDVDFDEESKANPLVTVGVFLGLVVAAAIICAVLWNFTHRQKDDGQAENVEETLRDEDYDTIMETETATTETQNETVENETQSDENSEEETDENTAEEGIADDGQATQEPLPGNESMEFTEVADTVTAKDATNLRSEPSTLDADNVIAQLLNGDTLVRIGINEATGWSQLDYNGQTVYAVTQYLTTDLTYKPPVAPGDPNRITTQDGRVIIFTDCDDYVSPKEYVNLRVEPSTSQGESTVKCQINYGTVVHRTGHSPDSGWSRVEYNGEILYVVSSMVYTTDAN